MSIRKTGSALALKLLFYSQLLLLIFAIAQIFCGVEAEDIETHTRIDASSGVAHADVIINPYAVLYHSAESDKHYGSSNSHFKTSTRHYQPSQTHHLSSEFHEKDSSRRKIVYKYDKKTGLYIAWTIYLPRYDDSELFLSEDITGFPDK